MRTHVIRPSTTRRHVTSSGLLSLACLVGQWGFLAWICGLTVADGASPLTPDLPVPTLAEQPEIVALIATFRDDRERLRVDLRRVGDMANTGLSIGITARVGLPSDASGEARQAVASAARQVAQVELWRAVVFAGEQPTHVSTDRPEWCAPFTERDTLAWCAAVLTATDDQAAADAIVSYAKIPPDTTRLVSAVLVAKPESRADLLGDLARRLRETPKDAAVAMAVDVILRRGVGDDAARSELSLAARAVADETVPPLRDAIAHRVKSDRGEALKAIIGSGRLPVQATTFDGQAFDSQSLRGKTVCFMFWRPASATCLEKLPQLRETYESLRDDGLEIVLVHTHCVGRQVREFQSRHPDIDWIQLADSEALRKGGAHPLATAVGVAATDLPAAMVIDRDGIVRAVERDLDLEALMQMLRRAKAGESK